MENFNSDKSIMLKSALCQQKKFLDTSSVIINDDWETDPTKVRHHIANMMAKATRSRHVSPPDDFWQAIYDDKVCNSNAFLETNHDISMEEFTNILSNCGNNKASGPSKIPIECWKHATATVKAELLRLCNICLQYSCIPREWKHASICPIPKTTDWQKNIENTRPITLLETARKIFTKIITNRLEIQCRTHNLLQGFNHCTIKGSSCNNAILAITEVLDHAHRNNQEAWIAFQDMRKAYDSVAWQGLQLAMARINIPDHIIKLFEHIYKNRKSYDLTAHSPTDFFSVEDGIDQGETYAPLLWRIFYDPLLVAVNKFCQDVAFQFKTCENIHPAVAEILKAGPHINHAAFVDDTMWISNSREGLEKITKLATSFFTMNDITINATKTEVIAVNPGKDQNQNESSFDFGPEIKVPIRSPNWPIRYLGTWITSSKNNTCAFNKVSQEIETILKIATQKTISDKVAIYIVNAVILPIIEYRTQARYVSERQMSKWDANIHKFIRAKTLLGRHVPNSTIHHPNIYNIPSVKDHLYSARISNALAHLSSTELTGQIVKYQLAKLQDTLWTEISPVLCPKLINNVKQRFHNNYIGMFIKGLNTYQVHIDIPFTPTYDTISLTPILDIFPRQSSRQLLIPAIRKMNIRFIQDIM